MKKLIIFCIVLVAFVSSISTVDAKAITKLWDNSTRLPDGNSQEIYSDVLDRNKLRVVKFKDGENICYITITVTNGGYNSNPSMSCSIK